MNSLYSFMNGGDCIVCSILDDYFDSFETWDREVVFILTKLLFCWSERVVSGDFIWSSFGLLSADGAAILILCVIRPGGRPIPPLIFTLFSWDRQN